MKRRPVILDTDIGDDIDDTWALAMLLKSPELDVKLVTADTGDTTYRARLIARLLDVAGRTDVPVGVGLPNTGRTTPPRQTAWVEGYDLGHYPGTVHADGVQAIIRTIMDSPELVTLICIGPVPNIAEALRREPGLAARARFAGMHGSFHWHITSNLRLAMEPGQYAEWNVLCDAVAAQAVFAAPWTAAAITPVDTCARVVLDGERYRRVRDSADPLMRAVIENYRIWAASMGTSCDPQAQSSVLFDTVAVHLAHTTRWLRTRRMGVRVDGEGYTREDAAARPFQVALEWEDYDAYADDLVERLLGPVTPAAGKGR